MLDSAVDKRSLRVLISSYDFPPIPYDLAEAFNRAGVEVSLLITSYGTEPPFFRYLIKCVNKFVRHFRFITGKTIRFFEKHLLGIAKAHNRRHCICIFSWLQLYIPFLRNCPKRI